MECDECGKEFVPEGRETVCSECLDELALLMGAFFGISEF